VLFQFFISIPAETYRWKRSLFCFWGHHAHPDKKSVWAWAGYSRVSSCAL